MWANVFPPTGSVFKSTWEDCPSEWTQPRLAGEFGLLRAVTSLSNRALAGAQEAQVIRSSLEAQVTLHTHSQAVSSTLRRLTESESLDDDIELSLSDCLIVSEASVVKDEEATPLTPGVALRGNLIASRESVGQGGLATPIKAITGERSPLVLEARTGAETEGGVVTSVEGGRGFCVEDWVRWREVEGERAEEREDLVRAVVRCASETSGCGKCPRCWRWVREEGEELCGRCRRVEALSK